MDEYLLASQGPRGLDGSATPTPSSPTSSIAHSDRTPPAAPMLTQISGDLATITNNMLTRKDKTDMVAELKAVILEEITACRCEWGPLPPPKMAATRAFAPAQLTYWSNNVQGLNSPEKRAHLHRRLWSAKASVVFLQETHLKGGDAPKLENRRFPLGFYANHPDTKKAGVAILFAHSVPFQNTQTLADPNGRYLFLRGTIADHEYTFACLYGPNRKQHKFLRQVLAKLEKFRGALLIVAGDLNMPLDPIRDTSRGQSAIPTHCLKAAQRFLHKMGLVDCWRTYHPDDRDYTHYSAVHAHYSRIDYIFMAQEYLNLLRSADLGIMDHSDHAPNDQKARAERDFRRSPHTIRQPTYIDWSTGTLTRPLDPHRNTTSPRQNPRPTVAGRSISWELTHGQPSDKCHAAGLVQGTLHQEPHDVSQPAYTYY
ncbi:Hypothetical predicted protein [Pelobates cultripes]|uniref:exodeoxyribonuclease III n=1 Tax=Pelobates cultripes TaxID=61616 RepID=A0AAD1TJ80_PELCU|nr:Hypothetical predicted protein [Pelobates cultripes]